MEFTINGKNVSTTVDVIESTDRTLLLGMEWLDKVEAQMNMGNGKGKLNIKTKEGYVDVPIEFLERRKETDEYEEEYEDEELEEALC